MLGDLFSAANREQKQKESAYLVCTQLKEAHVEHGYARTRRGAFKKVR